MSSANEERGTGTARPLSALPSVQARVLAFAAILVAGISGGLIGFSTVKVGCHRSCSTPEGIGGVLGAVMAAGGVAVIAVLVLRAMGEWRSIKETRDLEMMMAAAAEALASPSVAPAPPEPAAPPATEAPPGAAAEVPPAVDEAPPGAAAEVPPALDEAPSIAVPEAILEPPPAEDSEAPAGGE